MFHKYATISHNKTSIQKPTFDDIKNLQSTMSLGELFTFLNDFDMNKKFNMHREDVKRLIKLINIKNESKNKNLLELDMYGFMEFIL